MSELEVWRYLSKELAKLDMICEAYDKYFNKIKLKNHRYDAAFQMILDGFTSYIFINLSKFFDRRRDSWSLYSFKKVARASIDEGRNIAEEFIEGRHNRYAHLSKDIVHGSSFSFLSDSGVNKVKRILDSVYKILCNINNTYGFDESWAREWIGAQDSIDNMLDDLEKYDHMKAYDEEMKAIENPTK